MCKFNIEQRDKNLFEVFKEILSNTPYPICLKDVLKRTVSHPAKRFYISSRRAADIITQIRGGSQIKMSPERTRMFNHIIKLIEDQEVKCPDKPLKHVIEDVLDTPAPEFYLKPSSAKIILHYERNKQKKIQYDKIRKFAKV